MLKNSLKYASGFIGILIVALAVLIVLDRLQ